MNELVERHRLAYEKVNDGECPQVRYCGGGWYQVGETRVRQRKLEQMAQQLEWRAKGDELGYGDIFLYPRHRTLVVNGRQERLTPMTARLLAYLMTHPGRLLSKRVLMRQIWETDYLGDTRTLQVHICWVRKALGEDRRELVQTVRDVGYRFGGQGSG
ncbi:MAG: response regulator transcription factor [Anaerolineales bacterium]|nr:MAG: response regulator transcription factor [Anaerolineales bacterium]